MGFGIYNVYSRKNAASISFRQNQDSGKMKPLFINFGIVQA